MQRERLIKSTRVVKSKDGIIFEEHFAMFCSMRSAGIIIMC